jgi:hypothetical protein
VTWEPDGEERSCAKGNTQEGWEPCVEGRDGVGRSRGPERGGPARALAWSRRGGGIRASKTVNVEIKPPKDAQAGEYPITVRVSIGASA